MGVVLVGSDEDDRAAQPGGAELSVQVEAADGAKADVDHEAVGPELDGSTASTSSPLPNVSTSNPSSMSSRRSARHSRASSSTTHTRDGACSGLGCCGLGDALLIVI